MFVEVAVRDLEITLAALVLAWMTEVRSDALHSGVAHERSAQGAIAAGCARAQNRAEIMHQGRSWTLFRALSVSIHAF
jgi:hypothetical protein